jgi:hypothetical protein
LEEKGGCENMNSRKRKDKEDYEDEDENEDIEDDVIIPDEKNSEYFVHENVSTVNFNCLKESFKCKIHQDCKRQNLKFFLDKKDEANLQTEHVLDVTRNFDHRIKSFRKNILCARQSPLQVQYYHDRVEFQARYVILSKYLL